MSTSKSISAYLLAVAVLTVGISCSPNSNSAPTIEVYDGFESKELSNLWETDRFAPGAVEMQTNVVRAGHGAAKITVRSCDVFEAGINGNRNSERAELLEARKLTAKENSTYEQSFSLFIPTNFPIVPIRLVLAQWKQHCSEGGNCSDDSPVIALRYVSGLLHLTHQIGNHPTNLFETREELRGKWTDFKFQLRFTTNETGLVKAWINGKQVVDYHGTTAYPETPESGYPAPSRFYFKMGLYRNVMAEPMTVYIDEYRKRELAPGS